MIMENIFLDSVSSVYLNAYQTLSEVGPTEFAALCAKLGFFIGSYTIDRNPDTLEEVGQEALGALKEAQQLHPDAVASDLIEQLEASLTQKKA